MRALRKLIAVGVATGFLVSSGGEASWRLGQGSPVARADTLIEVEGSLVSGDAVWYDGSLYDQYLFSVEGGQYVTISLESNDFDPYLILLDPNGERIGENDDISRLNRNARLSLPLATTGVYTAVANSYQSGTSGSYAIKIDVDDDWAALSQTLAQAAVPGGNAVCTDAIADMTRTLETDREVNAVVSPLQLDGLYANRPSVRPHGVNVSVDGPAAISVMFSPQLLTQLSAQVVASCFSVGAVVFSTESEGADALDYERIFGFLPSASDDTAQMVRGEAAAERVTEFACMSYMSDDPSALPSWGERLCSGR